MWASKLFESLCNVVFMDCDLNLETKRLVYYSVVLGVLLYGAETLAPHRFYLKNWSGFIVAVYVVLWVLRGLYSGESVSPLPS